MQISLKPKQASNLLSLAQQRESLATALANVTNTERAILDAILEDRNIEQVNGTGYKFINSTTIEIQVISPESEPEILPDKKEE